MIYDLELYRRTKKVIEDIQWQAGDCDVDVGGFRVVVTKDGGLEIDGVEFMSHTYELVISMLEKELEI